MDERFGFIGIVVEDKSAVPAVNEILSGAADCIRGRLGLPDPQSGIGVITLVVAADSDRIGAITGKLGRLKGIRVKSAMTTAVAAPKGENV